MDDNSAKQLLHTDVLADKSFWLAVLVPVIVMVGKVLGLNLDSAMVAMIVGPVLAFIVASKTKQAIVAKELAKSAGDSASASVDSLDKAAESIAKVGGV